MGPEEARGEPCGSGEGLEGQGVAEAGPLASMRKGGSAEGAGGRQGGHVLAAAVRTGVISWQGELSEGRGQERPGVAAALTGPPLLLWREEHGREGAAGSLGRREKPGAARARAGSGEWASEALGSLLNSPYEKLH